MLKYSISIMWSEEDKGYIAVIPEFQNLSAFGKTYEKALQEAKIAVEGYMESLQEAGEMLPQPRQVSSHSGQIRLRMPRDLHGKLATEATSQGVSLNTYMICLLSGNHSLYKAKSQIDFAIHQLVNYNSFADTSPRFIGQLQGESNDFLISDGSRDTWQMYDVRSTEEL